MAASSSTDQARDFFHTLCVEGLHGLQSKDQNSVWSQNQILVRRKSPTLSSSFKDQAVSPLLVLRFWFRFLWRVPRRHHRRPRWQFTGRLRLRGHWSGRPTWHGRPRCFKGHRAGHPRWPLIGRLRGHFRVHWTGLRMWPLPRRLRGHFRGHWTGDALSRLWALTLAWWPLPQRLRLQISGCPRWQSTGRLRGGCRRWRRGRRQWPVTGRRRHWIRPPRWRCHVVTCCPKLIQKSVDTQSQMSLRQGGSR